MTRKRLPEPTSLACAGHTQIIIKAVLSYIESDEFPLVIVEINMASDHTHTSSSVQFSQSSSCHVLLKTVIKSTYK